MNRTPPANLTLPLPEGIRRLTEADALRFADLCARYPLRMLTLRMHIESYGYQSESLLVWGAFASDGEHLEGILFRLNNTFILADVDGSSAPGFAALIDSQSDAAGVRGTVETVAGVQAHLKRYISTNWELSTCLRLQKPPECPSASLERVRRAVPEDLDLLAAHYGGAGIMFRSRSNVASRLQTNRVFVVEEPADGLRSRRIVSSALLNVEGKDAGLIGGVFTHPESRGNGYAAACTSALALDLQGDNKLPVLFYENPVAGRVYRRLGFEECGRWALLYLAPH